MLLFGLSQLDTGPAIRHLIGELQEAWLFAFDKDFRGFLGTWRDYTGHLLISLFELKDSVREKDVCAILFILLPLWFGPR